MHEQHDVLDQRHGARAPHVEDVDDGGHAEDHQHALPGGRGVAGVRDFGHGLDECADEEGARGGASLP